MAEKAKQAEEATQEKIGTEAFSNTFANTIGLALAGAVKSLGEYVEKTDDTKVCGSMVMLTDAFNRLVQASNTNGLEE